MNIHAVYNGRHRGPKSMKGTFVPFMDFRARVQVDLDSLQVLFWVHLWISFGILSEIF